MTKSPALCCWLLLAASALGAEPLLIAHRGLALYAPENTMPAFAACVELGLGFELDIYSSRDERLVVIHSANLDSTTTGPARPVHDFSLAELKRFDAGVRFSPSFRGTTIPTLEEVLAMVQNRRHGPTLIALNVKQITREGERQLVAMVAQHGLLEESFAFDQDEACSRRLKALNPAFRIGQNVSRKDLGRRIAADDLDVFLLTFVPADEEMSALRQRKKTVLYNFSGVTAARRNPAVWDRVREAGVDGMLTDFALDCRLHWRGAP